MHTPKRLLILPTVSSSPLRRRGLSSMALGLAALVTACGGGDGVTDPAKPSEPSQLQPRTLQALPTNCQDIQAVHPTAGDGDYVLYIHGDATLPWTVYCHGMAGTPTEYLSLMHGGDTSNYSLYTAGGRSPGTPVRTAYARLRIDPSTLRVNTADQTFAWSTGSLTHAAETVTAMPFAVAMSCNRVLSASNVDLRDTPFAVAEGQFAAAGADAQGSAVYSENQQVVSLTGGGYCGWVAPVGSYNPFNQAGAWLQLQYRSSTLPSSCLDIQAIQPEATDGEYTLYANRNPLKPWTAWCHDMAGTPAEYLPLVHTGTSNYSQYTAGGYSPGTSVRTEYTRLRLDPVTLRVTTSDQTFSSSTGQLQHGAQQVTSMPYAVAMGCNRWGVGNVDLRGTPFAVASNTFSRGGASSEGSSFTHSSGNQVVNLSGFGICGWAGPLGSYNPFNQSGMPLALVYAGLP
ncbi:GON domain-containing protein [Stigmatella aurantiaca]|uniref:GON domain-containing protein n=1 Tax=Stigmatella aurantiaca (strain DW4/3-1) TaxID=378806 RepID=Q094Q1_STIAD|nr:GON domain-containing protein [Stigmatella aurantiaca]ADO75393.1 uncharacterized protein STAUR_7638 [Stigmatella aurantiaca DW4/3-1]EAU67186.1 hypothetical protein STIAU_5755 [Stigmatella aurantiaca DW4/3-1]